MHAHSSHSLQPLLYACHVGCDSRGETVCQAAMHGLTKKNSPGSWLGSGIALAAFRGWASANPHNRKRAV